MPEISKINVNSNVYDIKDDEARKALRMANRLYALYDGEDLSVKFAAEIGGYASVWAWISARIKAVNFNGINVGDFIPFTAGGNNFKAEVAGIDTYYNYGDTAVQHHIDFITRDCWPDTKTWNPFNYNNGTTVSPNPWLASDIYAWLNGLAMQVPGSTAAGGLPLTAVDYTANGIYPQLPQALKDVIIQKRLLLPRRYTAGELLIDDNNWDWADAGFLWLPSEVEVYGCGMWGTKSPTTPGYSDGGFVQYPIFGQSMKRIKGAGDGGARTAWWLLSVGGGNSTTAAIVDINGHAYYTTATTSTIRAPLGFRVA